MLDIFDQKGFEITAMKYSDIKAGTLPGTFKIGAIDNVPDISAAGTGDASVWFLGPRAENQALLNGLIEEALNHIYRFRGDYLPGDPAAITPAIKSSLSYQRSVETMNAAYRELLGFMKDNATPFFSLRYQGHMLWDNTLPALAGYFAAMLHNPNNVSIQASTSTTPLAILVGWDLCRMFGFPFSGECEPWSHLTADGSLANIEASWALREAKFLPFAARTAMLTSAPDFDKLKPVRPVSVKICDGTNVDLLNADPWQLCNIKLDDCLALPQNIADACGIDDVFSVWDLLIRCGINTRGWLPLLQDALTGIGGTPVVLVPSTKHYCWPKMAAVCGYGSHALIDVFVDADARMDIKRLDAQLQHCLEQRIPVVQVVAVLGSTEESAIDPLTDILALREKFRNQGLDFNIHADAAWGGYAITALRNDFRLHQNDDQDNLFAAKAGEISLTDYASEQLQAIRECDSVIVDPHKWGYVPYPAGSVIYRQGELRRLTTFSSVYINADSSVRMTEPSVGVFGLEGSKPGAAAASVFLSHRCIRPSRSGHGRLIDTCINNARQFYIRLLCLNDERLNFIVTPLPRLPAERSNGDAEAQLRFIRARLLNKTSEAIFAEAETAAFFKQLGPDLNILDYAFNFRRADGGPNCDAAAFNAFNEQIYNVFHIDFEHGHKLRDHRYLLTKTTFNRREYGDEFFDAFSRRLGLSGAPPTLNCLRSVIMVPYVDHTGVGSFFNEIIEIIRETVSEIAASM